MAEVRAKAGVPTATDFGGFGAPTPCAPIVVDSTTGNIYTLMAGDVVKLVGSIQLTGDVTGSGAGSFAATISSGAVTYAKMQNVSATDRLLGRSSAGAGSPEEIVCTAAGRAILDDADAATQRATLGLTTLANIAGTGTNDSASAGNVGEIQSGSAAAPGTGLTSGLVANIVTLSLTAGDWDADGVVGYTGGATTKFVYVTAGLSSTSATLGALGTYTQQAFGSGGVTLVDTVDVAYPLPTVRFSLSGTTNVYLVARASFSGSTANAYGLVRARRVR